MTNDDQVSSGALNAGTATQKQYIQGYTGEVLLSTRPKTYRKIVELLSQDRSTNSIAAELRVSRRSVEGVAFRQSATIAQRKSELSMMVSDIAHIGAARVADKIGKANTRDAIIGTGVAIDKFLALNGQGNTQVNVAVVLPTAEERAIQDARFSRLEAITARLALPEPKA